jgi:acetyl esterase/lipase
MRYLTSVVVGFALLGWPLPRATAQKHHGSERHAAASANCYDPSDRSEIRLWNGQAPGAVGNDPCRDIPYLRIFPATRPVSGETPAILVIPGGGYDRLSDEKEHAPVAEYFSQNFNVTTFTLYYRLVQADGTYR